MRKLDSYLGKRSFDPKLLLLYGFVLKDNQYVYEEVIFDHFLVVVSIGSESYSKIIDLDVNSEYFLVDVLELSGNFVRRVASRYDDIIKDIISKCTVFDWANDAVLKVTNYVKDKYGDSLEFLWGDSLNGVFRLSKNKKWYGILMNIKANRLDPSFTGSINVLDVRYFKGKVDEVIDYGSIFPGYHMNKQSWITINLDAVKDFDKVFSLIDNSYEIALKQK